MILRANLKIFADYNQFYIWDPVASDQNAPEDWTDEDVEVKAKANQYVFVMCPERNTEVPVTIEIHESDPGFSISAWDHIVESSIDIPNGVIEVHECTGGSCIEGYVEAGTYKIRALYRGLDTLSEDQLDGDDYYKVCLWKGERIQTRVIKSHNA